MERFIDPRWWLNKVSSRECRKEACWGRPVDPHSHHLTFVGRVRYCGLRSLFTVR